MAGSRRSPVLKEQWNADPDRDPRDRDRDRRRGRGPNQNRGRGRYRDRGRHSRGNDRRYDYPRRSPPPRASRFEPDSSHDSGGFASQRSPPRGSPGASPGFHVSRHSNNTRPPSSSDWDAHPSGSLERDNQGPRRAESPFGPPSKRQRTRSPSPRGPRTSFSNRRSSYSKHSDRRDRSPLSEVVAEGVVLLEDDPRVEVGTAEEGTVVVLTSQHTVTQNPQLEKEGHIHRLVDVPHLSVLIIVNETRDIVLDPAPGTLRALQDQGARHLLSIYVLKKR
ncbi:hypothetical protein N7450_006006 [Penicillium hetheringtonii]|uniref:Uncharacterized protein n=1 Tax=Penicillium hetheringtonii TaxID=911720 RepID=A0AAD6DKU6_9EURO|nr:hypothetical protein N7450_006006 [Penicillium hetheringtonii]